MLLVDLRLTCRLIVSIFNYLCSYFHTNNTRAYKIKMALHFLWVYRQLHVNM